MNSYTKEKWTKRHRTRDDISCYLTHLTKPNSELDSIGVLIKILNEQKLIGSNNTGFIQGSDTAVCFQDAPIHGIAQNTLHEQYEREQNGGKVRYKPIGLMFSKPYVFNKDGRPVIYETKDNANNMFQNMKWRIVTYDLTDEKAFIDWTHEREWRVKGDFHFELKEVYVILTNHISYKRFLDEIDPAILSQIAGIITLDPILT